MHQASNLSFLPVNIRILGLLSQLSVMCFLSKDVSLTAPRIAAMYCNAVHKSFVPSTHIFLIVPCKVWISTGSCLSSVFHGCRNDLNFHGNSCLERQLQNAW
uniref:Secreted protein n=1 Tax=Rhipicephalus appendiculatus TaxID=34631 RepID=A0A131YDZ4_RHIAP